MKKFILLTPLILIILALGCTKDSTITCDTSNQTYTNSIKDILSRSCTNGCHTSNTSSSGHSSAVLDNYTSIKSAISSNGLNSAFYKSITHSSGASPMPKGGAKIPECDINKIKAWIEVGMPE